VAVEVDAGAIIIKRNAKWEKTREFDDKQNTCLRAGHVSLFSKKSHQGVIDVNFQN
jgi:hypothetical protein